VRACPCFTLGVFGFWILNDENEASAVAGPFEIVETGDVGELLRFRRRAIEEARLDFYHRARGVKARYLPSGLQARVDGGDAFGGEGDWTSPP